MLLGDLVVVRADADRRRRRSGSPEYAAYRDEILFKQTVGRYAAAWHHVKGWYYFIVEVIPPLWLPWSLLLIWLVPRFKAAFHERDARVWLPLFWVLMVVLFFSCESRQTRHLRAAGVAGAGDRGAAVPRVAARRAPGVRRAGFVLAARSSSRRRCSRSRMRVQAKFAVDAITAANLDGRHGVVRLSRAVRRRARVRLAARAARGMARRRSARSPSCSRISSRRAMNGERSGADFVRGDARAGEAGRGARAGRVQGAVPAVPRPADGELRPSARLRRTAGVLRRRGLAQRRAGSRVAGARGTIRRRRRASRANATMVGRTSGEDWYLVRAPAAPDCAAKGHAARAISL